jgi:hypothetical protein
MVVVVVVARVVGVVVVGVVVGADVDGVASPPHATTNRRANAPANRAVCATTPPSLGVAVLSIMVSRRVLGFS